MKFFEYFDKVYCINLKHREDRKLNILNECNKYNLGEVEFFDAINGNQLNSPHAISPGAYGLILSNIEILKQSKQNNYKQIVIMEDDCYFNEEILNINEYIKFLPEDWDMFYLGGNHNTHLNNTSPPLQINAKIIKLHLTYSTHFIAIKSRMFDPLIKAISTFKYPLDVIYTGAQKKYNVYCTNKCIAKQTVGFSDIENKVVNYNNLIK